MARGELVIISSLRECRYKEPNLVEVANSNRLRWAGHKLLVVKPYKVVFII